MSHWAYLFGVPVSLIGAVAYMVLLFAAVLKLTTDSEKCCDPPQMARRRIDSRRIYWNRMSWIFSMHIAKYMIGAFCVWCRASAITMTVLFLISIIDVAAAMRIARRPAVDA